MMHDLRKNLARRIASSDFVVIENYDKGEIFAHFAVDVNQLVKTALSHQCVASFGSVDFLFTLHCLAIGNWRAFYFVQSDTGDLGVFLSIQKSS